MKSNNLWVRVKAIVCFQISFIKYFVLFLLPLLIHCQGPALSPSEQVMEPQRFSFSYVTLDKVQSKMGKPRGQWACETEREFSLWLYLFSHNLTSCENDIPQVWQDFLKPSEHVAGITEENKPLPVTLFYGNRMKCTISGISLFFQRKHRFFM